MSNFVLACWRCDVFLGMTWPTQANPFIDFGKHTFDAMIIRLPLEAVNVKEVEINNIGVKTFRSMWREESGQGNFQIISVLEKQREMKKCEFQYSGGE